MDWDRLRLVQLGSDWVSWADGSSEDGLGFFRVGLSEVELACDKLPCVDADATKNHRP